MKDGNAYRIDTFVVVYGPFDHSLRQRRDGVRIRMIADPLVCRLLDPSVQFDVSVSALRLFLAVLVVFHVHVLLDFAQVLLGFRYDGLQLRWREAWSVLHVRELQDIALTAIWKLTASLQRVVNAIANGLVCFSVVLL